MFVTHPALSRESFRQDSVRSGECRRQPPLLLMRMSEQALPLLVCSSKQLVEQLLGLGKPRHAIPEFTEQASILSTVLGLTRIKALGKHPKQRAKRN